MDRKSVTRTIKVLIIKKVLFCRPSKHGNIYRINKNYKEWVVAGLPLPGRGELAPGSGRGESAPGVGASPRKEVGATLCVEGRGEFAPLNRQIDNRQETFSISSLKTEIADLRKLGYSKDKIKRHFSHRNIAESIIDIAMKKYY